MGICGVLRVLWAFRVIVGYCRFPLQLTSVHDFFDFVTSVPTVSMGFYGCYGTVVSENISPSFMPGSFPP